MRKYCALCPDRATHKKRVHKDIVLEVCEECWDWLKGFKLVEDKNLFT